MNKGWRRVGEGSEKRRRMFEEGLENGRIRIREGLRWIREWLKKVCGREWLEKDWGIEENSWRRIEEWLEKD